MLPLVCQIDYDDDDDVIVITDSICNLLYRGKFEGKTITRQYTPISDLDCHGHFDVLIKVFLF